MRPVGGGQERRLWEWMGPTMRQTVDTPPTTVEESAGWTELVPRTRLQPDTRHQLPVDATDPVTHVRLDVFPDGGLARLRVLGELSESP